MELLRYAPELRDPAEYFNEVPAAKPQKEMVDLAVQLIAKKSGGFDPTKFEDHYGTALKELVEEKVKGHTIVAKEVERPKGGNVVNLHGSSEEEHRGRDAGESEDFAWREEEGVKRKWQTTEVGPGAEEPDPTQDSERYSL
jgi:non-homologous end joining protein Ku